MRYFSALLLTACILAGCTPVKEILYRGQIFGFMTAPLVMQGDDDRIYHFQNADSDKIPEEGRIVALFDVYEKIEGTENEYTAEMLQYSIPVYKDPTLCTTPEESEALGTDAVRMLDGDYSGGCLNMLCSALFNNDSGITHVVSLETDSTQPVKDTLHFILHHNAGGDAPEGDDNSNFTDYQFYASFPISEMLSKDKDTVLEIKWFWDNEWHRKCATITK